MSNSREEAKPLEQEDIKSSTPEIEQTESPKGFGDETEITLSIDDKTINDETVGDLSTISAIQTDTTRFANLRISPSKAYAPDSWSPTKLTRSSTIASTPSAGQRPFRLVSRSRSSNSSNEDDEATPRRLRANDTADLLNLTAQSNVILPPPSAPRTSRRSPSGRGAFPIRVNPSPTHKSQASIDRERSAGRSSPKTATSSQFPDRSVPATPASHRHSMYAGVNTIGTDLLDLDLEPMATPRSIPTVTPRELETLRSELQSRISGLEATLSGKEAEVMALKRSITDAEVRVGKTSEELRTERATRGEVEHRKGELERRSREMEEVIREVKQNAFMEELEREKLRRQIDEADRKAEDQEVKILELNATLEALRSDRHNRSMHSPEKDSLEPATPSVTTALDVDAAVKDATERVARELHTLYKGKHERKVADLKVSYEKRWIKQVDQLRSDLKAAQEEISKLQQTSHENASNNHGNSVSGPSDAALSKMEGQVEELRRWNDEVIADKKFLEAEVAGLKQRLNSFHNEAGDLRKELEQERVEKGELVAQVDLFLVMSAKDADEREAQRLELEQERQKNTLLKAEREKERERLQQQTQAPISPPRSESSYVPYTNANVNTNSRPGSSTSVISPSPSRFRNSVHALPTLTTNTSASMAAASNGLGTGPAGLKARPMSMLQKPAAGLKYSSGIPGMSGLKQPAAYAARNGGLMEGIARMGAGGR